MRYPVFLALSLLTTSACSSIDDPNGTTPSGEITGAEFVVANTTSEEDFGNVAFDGTNYLATVQTHNASNTTSNAAAQMISGSGTLVGSLINFNIVADPPKVAFDGTNYLVVYASHTSGSDNGTVRGQFVSKAGAFVGTQFTISSTTTAFQSVNAIRFGGGTYFIAYTRDAGGTGNATARTYGRTVSTSGVVGSELTLSSGFTTEGFESAIFDGTNFFTVYTDESTIKGRFVTPAGALGSEVTVLTASGFKVENHAQVAFNGTNYLVVFPRLANGASTADAYGQLLTSAGAPSGSSFAIAQDAFDEFPVGVLVNGANFLVSYLDVPSATSGLRIRVRWVGSTGVLGSPMTAASAASGKSPLGGVWLFNNSKYFTYYLRGTPSDATNPLNSNSWSGTDLYAALLTIPSP